MRRKSEGSPHPDNVRKMLDQRYQMIEFYREDIEKKADRINAALDTLFEKVKFYTQQ